MLVECRNNSRDKFITRTRDFLCYTVELIREENRDARNNLHFESSSFRVCFLAKLCVSSLFFFFFFSIKYCGLFYWIIQSRKVRRSSMFLVKASFIKISYDLSGNCRNRCGKLPLQFLCFVLGCMENFV